MKAVVHQALGHVVHGHTACVLDRAQIENALVCHAAIRPRVQHRIVRRQTGGHVVGTENGYRRGLTQTLGAHHGDVHPRDGQDSRRSPGGGRDGAHARGRAGVAAQRMVGQVRCQMRTHGHGAHSRATTAVRDAERLVQVEVRHIGTELARLGKPHKCIEVGAIHIHLATVCMHDLAQLANALLKHAVRGGVGDHGCGQCIARGIGLGAQVVEVDVAVGVAGHHHHRHAGHHRAGGVGAMR